MSIAYKALSRMIPISKHIGHEVWIIGWHRKPGSRKAGQEVMLKKPRLMKGVTPDQVPDNCKSTVNHTES